MLRRMNGSDFLKTINELDDELILGVKAKNAPRALYRSPWFWAAAVLMLAAVSFFAIRACLERGRLREVPFEEGSNLTFKLAPTAFSDFKGEIRDAGRQIHKKMSEYKPYWSSLPNCCGKDFASLEEAEAYLGHDALKALNFPFYVYSVSVNASGGMVYDPEADECDVYGIDISVSSQYDVLNAETGFIYARENIRILTDAHARFREIYSGIYDSFAAGLSGSDPYTYSYSLSEDDDRITEQTFYTYKANSGETAHIAVQHFGDDPYYSAMCYIVNDGMLFELDLTFYRRDAQRAVAELCRWADSFK